MRVKSINKTIWGHIRPYMTTQGHTKPYKANTTIQYHNVPQKQFFPLNNFYSMHNIFGAWFHANNNNTSNKALSVDRGQTRNYTATLKKLGPTLELHIASFSRCKIWNCLHWPCLIICWAPLWTPILMPTKIMVRDRDPRAIIIAMHSRKSRVSLIFTWNSDRIRGFQWLERFFLT